MKNYRTFNQVEESYFRDHPEEIDDYINLIFEAYAEDGNTGALLSSLRVLSRVKGVSKIAANSRANRTPIPRDSGHRFHLILDSDSRRIWTVVPFESGQEFFKVSDA